MFGAGEARVASQKLPSVHRVSRHEQSIIHIHMYGIKTTVDHKSITFLGKHAAIASILFNATHYICHIPPYTSMKREKPLRILVNYMYL